MPTTNKSDTLPNDEAIGSPANTGDALALAPLLLTEAQAELLVRSATVAPIALAPIAPLTIPARPRKRCRA